MNVYLDTTVQATSARDAQTRCGAHVFRLLWSPSLEALQVVAARLKLNQERFQSGGWYYAYRINDQETKFLQAFGVPAESLGNYLQKQRAPRFSGALQAVG